MCAQEAEGAGERGCVFLLNKKGLDNVVVDLTTVGDVEVTDDLLILRIGGEETRILGFWLQC